MAFQECFWHLWRTKETAMHHKDLLFDDRKEWQKKKELLKSLINTCRCWRFKIVAIKLCQPAKRTALTCVDSETLLLFFFCPKGNLRFFFTISVVKKIWLPSTTSTEPRGPYFARHSSAKPPPKLLARSLSCSFS